MSGRSRVIGVGNRWRRDDAAGLEVVARLRGTLPNGVELVEHEGEPTALIDVWVEAEAVWLVDTVSSGAPAGTVHRLDVWAQELPAAMFDTSTHHVGLAEAVELGRTVGRLPARLIVFGVEGESFAVGEGLSPAVAAAVERTADALRDEVVAYTDARWARPRLGH